MFPFVGLIRLLTHKSHSRLKFWLIALVFFLLSFFFCSVVAVVTTVAAFGGGAVQLKLSRLHAQKL